jgi:hypothetical protein
MVIARLERQAILDRPDPPHTVVVLDEAVLHRLIGTSAVMADQLVHLASMSERLHVSVHVLPATGANAGLSGPSISRLRTAHRIRCEWKASRTRRPRTGRLSLRQPYFSISSGGTH